MDRRKTLLAIPASLLVAQPALAWSVGGLLDAAKDAAGALTLTDEQVRAYAAQMAKHSDAEAKLAPASSPYGKRLAKLTQGMENDNGLNLNFGVYETKQVNAFAMADGTIRFYSGLMDLMTDDELRYVVGHEMGHIQAGHTRKRMQAAMSASAARKAVSASGTKAAVLADSELGDLFTQVVLAQYSQANENEADDYALQFMTRHGYDRKACVSALEKLGKLSGGGGTSWLSTHPAPRERAERMRTQIG